MAPNPVLAASWVPFLHVAGVVDLAGPRADGSLTVAASGHLLLLAPDRVLSPFARGSDGYVTALGPEPYIALPEIAPVERACPFPADAVFAIEPGIRPSIIVIDAQGRARHFADLPRGAFLDGIAFDDVGGFGYRLLVTAAIRRHTTVFALDCNAAAATITTRAPVVEGGIVVAPASFGDFGGDLIAPDEKSGLIYAIEPSGKTITLVRSHVPNGSDIGVESAGFIPSGSLSGRNAYLADRLSPGNAHAGTNSILQLSGQGLARAGVEPGDLLVASEGGAKTIVVRCRAACVVRHIADGPTAAHAEGHIVFAPSLN